MTYLQALYQYYYGRAFTYEVGKALRYGIRYTREHTEQLISYNFIFKTKLWKLFNERL